MYPEGETTFTKCFQVLCMQTFLNDLSLPKERRARGLATSRIPETIQKATAAELTSLLEGPLQTSEGFLGLRAKDWEGYSQKSPLSSTRRINSSDM